jgi:hypothetical protein
LTIGNDARFNNQSIQDGSGTIVKTKIESSGDLELLGDCAPLIHFYFEKIQPHSVQGRSLHYHKLISEHFVMD